MGLRSKYILPIIIALGLSLPQGLTSMFLPSVRVSSIYDGVNVQLAVLSFQAILISLYVLISIDKIVISWSQAILIIFLFYFGLAGALFSLSPGGYISYSLLWCIFPLAVRLHIQSFKYKYTSVEFINDIYFIGVIFFPFYLIDIALSIFYIGPENFASFMLASNGHSFISFLFSLIFLIKFLMMPGGNNYQKGKFLFFSFVYFGGGVLSAGRVAFASFVLCLLIASPAKVIKFAILIFPLLLITLGSVEKYNLFFNIILDDGFDDFRIWSSGISRLNFWSSHIEIFFDNVLAGAGGLATNVVKYYYDFQYDVFVDPHNELIFILSGFGVFGLAFIVASIALVSSFARVKRSFGPANLTSCFNSYLILLYIFICSLSNANSAKQNIQLIYVFLILMAFYTIVSSVKSKFGKCGAL